MADRPPANPVGVRGGAVRPNRVAMNASVGPVQAPQAGGGSAIAWGLLARNTEQLANVAHAQYDRQVAVESSQQGVLDAVAGRVRVLDRSTTRGGAYMDAALATTKLTAETNAAVAMTDFFRENPDNPAALQQQISDYADGAVGQANALDPATAVELRAHIINQSIPLINGAIANREQAMAAAKKDALQQAEAQQQVVLSMNAPNIFSPDPQQRAAASAAVIDATNQVQGFQSEEAANGFLMDRLASGHDASAIVNMQPELKARLSALISSAPGNIRDGIGIYSGYRSVERQQELWDQALQKYGSPQVARRRVAPPGNSQHNHGNAADLTYNGKSLDAAPPEVIKWMHQNAPEFGLKFPLQNDPAEAHHIEIQETRGGAPFTGKVNASGFSHTQQDINDALIGPGFKSWFRGQTNKPQAYLDFLDGKTELPMTLPDGTELTVNVRNSLSEKARGQVEEDLRAQMNFETSLRKQTEEAGAAEANKRSDDTLAGYTTGILANGQQLTVDGKSFVARKPTQQDLLTSLNNGDLSSGDYVTLTKAINEPRPVTSDPDIERAIFTSIEHGENPQAAIMANLPHLTADDAKKWTDYYATKLNADGKMNEGQQFYLGQVTKLFSQSEMSDTWDDSRLQRGIEATNEARTRMLGGEKPEDVFNDIKKRSAFDPMGDKPAFIRPRFFVPDAVNGDQIDVPATFKALNDAVTTQSIPGADYDQQIILLKQWDEFQTKVAAEQKPAAGAKP